MNKYEDIIIANFKSEHDIEKVIQLLKENGASQIETVKTLISVLNIPLSMADDFVQNSSSWSSVKESNDFLKDKFLDNPDIN